MRMDRSLRYGRERFAQVLGVLEGRDRKLLRGYPNTATNRLRAAVLAVYACVRSHFLWPEDHAVFTELMFELRLLRADGRILKAIEALDDDACARFSGRLLALARSVSARSLPNERFREPRTDDGTTDRARRSSGA